MLVNSHCNSWNNTQSVVISFEKLLWRISQSLYTC